MVLCGSVSRLKVSSFDARPFFVCPPRLPTTTPGLECSTGGENFKLQQNVARSKVEVVEANMRESETAQERNRVKNELQTTKDKLTQVTSSSYTRPLGPSTKECSHDFVPLK